MANLNMERNLPIPIEVIPCDSERHVLHMAAHITHLT